MSEERNNLPDFDLPGDDSPESNVQPPVTEEVIEETPTIEVDPNAKAIFDIYRDEGFLTVDEKEFDGTYEGLRNALVKESQQLENTVFNAIVKSPPDFAQPIVELVLTKGQDLTKEELLEFVNTLQDSPYSEDNLPAEDFLKNYYKKELDWDDEDIEDRIENLKDKEALDTEAKKLFKKWDTARNSQSQQKLEEARQAKEQAKIQGEQFINNLSSTLLESYQKPKAQQLYNEFSTGTFKQKLEQILVNPAHLHTLIDFVSYYDGKDFNLDTYKKEAFSPSTDKIQKSVQKYWSSSNPASSSVSADPSSKKKIDLTKARFID